MDTCALADCGIWQRGLHHQGLGHSCWGAQGDNHGAAGGLAGAPEEGAHAVPTHIKSCLELLAMCEDFYSMLPVFLFYFLAHGATGGLAGAPEPRRKQYADVPRSMS